MKREIIIVFVSCIILAIIAGFVNNGVRKKKEAEVMRLRNEGYMYMLSMEGEFRYASDTVEVIEMKVDERQLLIDVTLYNEYHEEREVTVEQMLEEYNNFCNNSGSTEELDAFCDFDRADEFDGEEHSMLDYKGYIQNYLQDNFNLEKISLATTEQLQEAARYAAKKWKENPGEY